MAYLDSTNIKVFPAVRRIGEADPFSRLMSESTITSIVNRLIDYEGFVITKPTESISSGIFEFSIFGYYVKIEEVSNLISQFNNATDIYAYIDLYIADTYPGQSNNLSYKQLKGQDDNANYMGVSFVDSEPEAPEIKVERHSLHLLTKSDDSWVIPEASRLKFSKDTLALYDIDGGEI